MRLEDFQKVQVGLAPVAGNNETGTVAGMRSFLQANNFNGVQQAAVAQQEDTPINVPEILKPTVGFLENAANQVTQLGAMTIGLVPNALGSIGGELTDALVNQRMPTIDNIAERMKAGTELMDKVTYQPKTESGLAGQQVIHDVLTAVPKAIDAVDDLTGENFKVNFPNLYAATQSVGELAPFMVLAKGVHAGLPGKPIANPVLKESLGFPEPVIEAGKPLESGVAATLDIAPDMTSIAQSVAAMVESLVLSKTEQAAKTVERINEIQAKLSEIDPTKASEELLNEAANLQKVKERLERGYENISDELGGESSPFEPSIDSIQNLNLKMESANKTVKEMEDHFNNPLAGDSTVYSSPSLLAHGNLVEDLLLSTGIKSKVAVLDFADIKDGKFEGELIEPMARLAETKNFGVVKRVVDADGASRYIAIVNSPEILKGRKSADMMRLTEATLHEAFGHVVVGERYSWASEETKLSLEKDFQRFTKLPADEASKAFYPLKTGEIAIGVPEGMSERTQFKEWLVNGITKWATSEAEPIGLANKWFKKVADAFKKAFKKDGASQTPESIRAWMNSMFDSSRLADKVEVEQPVKIVEPYGGYKKVSITKQLEKLKAVVKPEELKAYEVGKIEGKDETHLGIYKKDSGGNKVLINQIKSTSRSSAQREANLFKYAHALASRGMSEPVTSSSARIRHYQDMLLKFKGEIQNVAEQTGQSFEQVWLDFLGNPQDSLNKADLKAIFSRSPQTERIWTGIENLAKHSPERLRKLIVYEKRVISKEVQELVKAEEVLKDEIAESTIEPASQVTVQNSNLNFGSRIIEAAQQSALDLIKVGSKVNLERISSSVIEKLRLSGKDARDAKKFIKENYESLRDGKKVEAEVHSKPDEIEYVHRGVGYNSGAATEGVGLYVARDLATAEGFGDNVYKNVPIIKPRRPLIADQLLLLEESAEVFEPIKSSDSEWVKLNKKAVKNTKQTETNFDENIVGAEISRLAKLSGYDAISVGDKSYGWYVLLDKELYKHTDLYDPKYHEEISRNIESQKVPDEVSLEEAQAYMDGLSDMAVRRKSKPITSELYEKINKIKKKKETTPEQASEKIKKRLAKEAEFVQETSKLEEAASKANVSLTEYLRAVGKDKEGNPLSEDTIAKILRKYQRLAKTIFTDQEHILRLGTALGLVDGTTGVAGLEAYIKTVFPKAQGPIKQLTITGRDILMKRMQDRWFELEGQKFDFSKIKTFRELVNLSREERASLSGWKRFKAGLAYYLNQNTDEIATTPAGSSLVHLLKNVLNSEAALYTRDYPARLQKIMDVVTDPLDREHILDVYEGKSVARNKIFQEGADLMREIYTAYGSEMERLGVRIQYKGGYTGEFKFDPNANHYPHMWEPGSFDKPSEKMLNSLLVSGHPVDAKQAAAIIKGHGARATRLAAPKFANLEMAREVEMEGYIRDPLKVTMQYLMSGSKRLAILREVGQQPEVRLAQLAWDHFQQSSDADSYNFAVKVINSVTGVAVHERLMEKSGWLANPLEFAALASTLQHSAFVQPGVLANTITVAGFKKTAEGIKRYIKADPRKAQMSSEWAQTLGANGRSVTKELLDEMHDSLSLATRLDKLMNFWRIPQIDTFFRNSATLTGRLHINEMVERAINLGDKKAEQELRRLGLSSAKFKELLEANKDELVEDELRKGAYAFAQRTNLVNDALTKAQWTMEHSSFSRMLTLLGRFSFQQHHFLKSLYKDDPRKLVKYLGVASAIGVPGYVAKTLMKGKNPIEDAKERGLFGTWLVMLQNAAGLGMFGDMTMDAFNQIATGKQGHAVDRVGGPIPGLIKDSMVGVSKVAHGDLTSASAMRLLLRSGVTVSAAALPPKYGIPIAGTLGLARPAIETLVKENK